MLLTAGTRLGRYEIVGLLGAGGMGEVYRARDDRLHREVAIKVLPASFAGDPDRLRRFEQEAQAAGALNHPNILAIYDIGTHDGAPYIVSELLDGESLRSRLSGQPLRMEQALEMARQLAEGLAAAHDKGIVHRDLKPENVFVTTEGRVKILDFGLAKLLGPTSESSGAEPNASTIAALTDAGAVLGTVGYMSPEQVRGDRVDRRSDIFSAGAVVYEMIAGTRAFRRGSSAETMSAILRDTPADLSALNPAVPPPLARAIRRCLEKRADDRFQSARDLGLALTESTDRKAAAPPASLLSRVPRRWLVTAALAVAAAAAALVPRVIDRGSRPASDAPIRSLAVLPLENGSDDPQQQYFADGMTEALTAGLARMRGLRVISRTSAMNYRSARKPLPEVARELDVEALVEGSIVRAGNRMRISARLIDARTDASIWSGSYDRDIRDVLALQAEVARTIAHEISLTLTPQDEAILASARPVNPDAHDAYLRGRFVLAEFTEAAMTKAIDHFKHAIEIDPLYAPAYAGLADAYSALRMAYAPPHAVMPRAKQAAARAVELDPNLAEAQLSMAWVHMTYDFDWPATEKALKRAIDLSPSLSTAHEYYALYLAGLGRHDEARQAIARAEELNPLSPLLLANASWVAYLARDYKQSAELNRRALDLDPNFWVAHTGLGLAYEKMGRFGDAVAALEKARQIESNITVLEMLAGAYAASGRTADAKRVLADMTEMAGQHYVCPYEVATVYAGLGDKASTLGWLEKGYKERADCMAWTGADPKLDHLHGDPRFEDLLGRLGLIR